MIKVPREFVLGNRRWSVRRVPTLGYDIIKGKRTRVLGICYAGGLIEIVTGLTERKLCNVFAHEFLHAIEYTFNIRLPHKLVNWLDPMIGHMLLRFAKLQEGKRHAKGHHRSSTRGTVSHRARRQRIRKHPPRVGQSRSSRVRSGRG